MAPDEPDASGHVEVDAPARAVYALISDPGTLARLAGEYRGHRWRGGASRAEVGARFVGKNKRGLRRWSTVSTITDADGTRFGFDVASGPLPVARWLYEVEPTGAASCRVTESTWDRRPKWIRPILGVVIGPRDRAAHNRRNIRTTLRRVKEHAEQQRTAGP